MSDEPASVSLLLHQLRVGNPGATGKIWNRYIGSLLPVARRKLDGLRTAEVDEEDILVSVFDRFFRAAKEERFTRLETRDDLWQILLVLTERRVADQYRKSHAEKRGGGNVVRSGQLNSNTESRDALGAMADKAATPEIAAGFADQLQVALARLSEESTREVALLRMEGFGTREIAEKLDVSLSSIERKLRTIRQVWADLEPA